MPRKIEGAKRRDINSMYPEDLVVIGVDTDPDELDELYDKDRVHLPLNPATVANIMKFGVIHPIVITKRGNKHVVVAGNRRTLHTREANLEIVSASQGELFDRKKIMVDVILCDPDKKDIEGISISENEHREMVPPLDRIRKARRYLDSGHTKEEAALAFGVTDKTISNWRKVLDLDQAVIDRVAKGDLGVTAALRLDGIPKEQQDKAAQELCETAKEAGKDKGPTEKEAREKSEAARGMRDQGAKSPGKKMIKKVIDEISNGNTVSQAESFTWSDLVQWLSWSIGECDKYEVKLLPEVMKAVAIKSRKRSGR